MPPLSPDITAENLPDKTREHAVIAALDIGSNSFHLVIARDVGADFQFLERDKQQIQLAAGLNSDNELTPDTIKRAMGCLDQFNRLIDLYQPTEIRAVATHTLRIASNAEAFIKKASKHFPAPIEVISGTEEARLIYQGVSHLSQVRDSVLVIDIGGGSTEFIIGDNFTERQLRSCPVGCVNLTKEFFGGGKLNKRRLVKLVQAVEKKLKPFRGKYIKLGWEQCLGSSGSIKMIDRMLKEQGYCKRTITLEHLLAMVEQILDFDRLEDICLPGLLPERAMILPAAIGILIAVFKSFGIEEMSYSRGALREGLLYSMIK